MNKDDYPLPARAIDYQEMMKYCDILMEKVAKYNPDEIIGVARSGMPFATFIAQKLDLDLGYYNPKYENFMSATAGTDKPFKRVVFIDENFVTGRTQKQIRAFMAKAFPNVEYTMGCVMLDLFCPDKECLHGKLLDFWADDMACFFKPIAIEERGKRFRDDEVVDSLSNDTQAIAPIAFDLDGVLIPDCDHIPQIGSLDEFYSLTEYMRPIFKPQGNYSIITARPAQHRSSTWTWCNKYLDTLPVRLHHECADESPGEYKARILNSNADIQTYVESDLKIVDYLKINVVTGCNIIHFDEYVGQRFMRE